MNRRIAYVAALHLRLWQFGSANPKPIAKSRHEIRSSASRKPLFRLLIRPNISQPRGEVRVKQSRQRDSAANLPLLHVAKGKSKPFTQQCGKKPYRQILIKHW